MAVQSQAKFVLMIIYGFNIHILSAKQVAMKVVDEPSSYGMNFNGGYQEQSHTDVSTLKMRVPPSNFSGPAHLKRLTSQCFSKTENSYKYEFCPFSNVTQYEQSLRWNPYSGVLGVWQEWEIKNNTFTAMIMSDGDSCGERFRSVKIIPKCADTSGIEDVSEPQTCSYEMVFLTPLVCHKHSMLVYPTLPEELRDEWDIVETKFVNGEITRKGYDKRLRKVFEKAGLQLEASRKEELRKGAEKKENEKSKADNADFSTLTQCSQEYVKLKEEVERLRAQVSNLNNKAYEDERHKFHDMHEEIVDYEDYGHHGLD